MKGNRIVLLLILIISIIIGIIYFSQEKELILNGNKEIILNINQEYNDLGVNLDNVSIDTDTPTAKARWVLIYIHFQIYSKVYMTNEFL